MFGMKMMRNGMGKWGGRNFPFAMGQFTVTDELEALKRYKERLEFHRRELDAELESVVKRIDELSVKK
ncbi:MAG: DUF5320 domain-containing protein [Caldisericaceae bacterium]|nr:DUF5320 domain-containing protein [Caldisericaceae bacterium]